MAPRLSVFNVFPVLFALTIAVLTSPLFLKGKAGQESRITGGYKFIKNYIPEDTDVLPQNWGIIQDRRGVIYSANQGGVVEYDGVSWRNIRIPNATARAIDMDSAGVIYVAGYNEIGRLEANPSGELRYLSLTGRLTPSQRSLLTTVYQVCHGEEGVWFRTSERLYLWTNDEFKVFSPLKKGSIFKSMFSWKDKMYIQASKSGLLELSGGVLTQVKGGGLFAGEKIAMAAPYDKRRLLIGLSFQGFYLYDGHRAERLKSKLDGYIKSHRLYHGISLGNGYFALGTLGGGLAIMDLHGRAVAFYRSTTGLQNGRVKYLYLDTGGNLWLALDRGISMIEWASPFSIYDGRTQLKGQPHSLARYQGRLVVGTSSGVYRLTGEAGQLPVFQAIKDLPGNCWSLLVTGDSLLAGTSSGIFQVTGGRVEQVASKAVTLNLTASRRKQDRVWVGTDGYLMTLRYRQGRWRPEHRFTHLRPATIRSIMEDEEGGLWLGTGAHGAAHLTFRNGGMANPSCRWYDHEKGLPRGLVHLFRADGRIRFATRKGLYRFEKKRDAFVPDLLLGKKFSGGKWDIFWLEQDRNGHVWFHSGRHNFHAVPTVKNGTEKSYEVSQLPFQRLPRGQIYEIFANAGDVWLSASIGVIRYDTMAKKNYRYPFSTLIRNITVNGEQRIYGGFNRELSAPLELDYERRNLQFDAAAVFFENESDNQYRYFMEGYDKKWSDWTTVNFKNYTNLDFGSYSFHVQGRGLYENPGREDVFRFRILRPWYHSYTAYTVYALLAFLGVYLIVRWRSSKLLREKERLDRVVEDRTHQLRQKTVQLEEQSDQLKEMDRIKSRFFANISHEFRTPLTLIMGPLDNLREGVEDDGAKKQLDLASRNSRRLLRLINQLLDLSKLESGKMKLRAVPDDLVQFLRNLSEPFEAVAEKHHLTFEFKTGVETLEVYFDPEKLEKIMSNLLSNALKFTPPGGSITLSLSTPETPEGEREVIISVKDSGKGIPGDQLSHIFDRFYQADITEEHHRKGSGIGLSLVKELVALHHGEVTVQSSQGEGGGTEFFLRLKLGREHLSDEEIVAQLDFNTEEESLDTAAAIETADPLELLGVDGKAGGKETQPGDKTVVLVVEDNADLRRYIRGSLEPDYNVMEAANGRIGIEKAREMIPDIVISDIMMPEKDGYELCRELKSDMATSHIPVVLLTAKASEENIVRGLETGADDYVTKPFSTRVLAARIHNLVELRRQLQLKLNREMVLQPSKISMSDMDREFLKDLQEVIEKNLCESEFNVEDLSKRLYMSRTTVYRKIQALSGETPTDFIRSYRLMRAAQLLKNKYGTVTDVAFEVGFSSRAYFTKCFKEKFHRLPSEYLQSESGPGS